MTYVFVDPDFEGPNNLRLVALLRGVIRSIQRAHYARSLKKSAPMHSSSPRAVESKK